MTYALLPARPETPLRERRVAAVVCPGPNCSRPAIVESRWAFGSTEGPLDMVKVRCEAGCWYTVPADELQVR
jgi:hypothetical protein